MTKGLASRFPRRVVLLAPPGAGKTTQARMLSELTGAALVSTGALLREEIEKRSPLGKAVRSYVERGELVADEIMVGLVHSRLVHVAKNEGYVLEGFPRDIRQAIALQSFEDEEGNSISPEAVVLLDVSGRELARRLAERASKEDRLDDTDTVIAHRLEVYRKSAEPLVHYYGAMGILVEIDGNAKPEIVQREIIEALGQMRH